MKIDNQVVEKIGPSDIGDGKAAFILANTIVDTLCLDLIEFDQPVVVENCLIGKLLIHSTWFKSGLIFRNNQVLERIDYQMGGHNENPMIISTCIFHEFFNFFDCQFNAKLEISNSLFLNGSNLLGNSTEGFKNTFDTGYECFNNIGDISKDSLESL